MSRFDPYRSSAGDLGYGRGGRGGGERWDAERFDYERDRSRFAPERERFEEREVIRDTRPPRRNLSRPRERSFDEVFEGRGRGRFEEDRVRERVYYDDEPRFEREPVRERAQRVVMEKEREYYSPSPPRRAPGNRPGFLRRQSSLDTFDRKPMVRYERREEDIYGPIARREDFGPPLPRSRALPPPRRYEREYEDIRVAEPDYYGDEEYRGVPERVREREIIRTRRRSKSRSRSRERSHRGSTRGSVRSSSVSSSSSGGSKTTVRSEFPKKGKTRMPAKLVSKKAIIDLGYPFEEEGETIIIQKALGRENIDEVIKLSEEYKSSKHKESKEETVVTNYLVGAEHEMHGGRSEAGTVVEEHRQEIFTVPPPPPPGWHGHPPPAPQPAEIITDTKITESHHHHHHHPEAIILDAHPKEEIVHEKIIERSDAIPVGPLALAVPERRIGSERAIRAEIKALEAEKEALRAEKRADRELRRADRLRAHGRASEGELVLYEQDRVVRGDEVTLVKRERFIEPEGGAPVRIEKDKKGRMSISVPKYYR
ncbi:hypothetical protein BP5796_07828 [Coleophoma crateriformis]|uniref:DUF8035 domain-containing protein n=1 Tax=Coleophoma crateriformis TaxID=565419 RepID=A0A3D8RD43_9HELO|nr:hypothetical protein BP5796_07828 [Coleophoma crateriformis]